MAREIIMPKAGMNMSEGVILKWLVGVGQEVEEGEALLEIETDKVTMEVESPVNGVLLRRYFDEGDAVPVVTVIAYVGSVGEQIPDAPPAAAVKPLSGETASPQTQTISEEKPDLSGYEYDIAVIGGGPAGYVAAIRAAQLGGKVILFEKDTLGGTCLNRGCIPTKTYLKTAEYIQHISHAEDRGILIDSARMKVDMEKIYNYKQGVVKKLNSGIGLLLKKRNVSVVNGVAGLIDEHIVTCGGKQYKARNILLCGGSKAGLMDIPGIDNHAVLTSDEILELQEIPPRLAVIGGGIIGCELAMAFAAFGSKVTMIELMDRLVPMMEKEISDTIAASMKKLGVSVFCGKQVEAIEKTSGGAKAALSGGESTEADYVLLSIGRVADTECLGVIADRIKTERGKVVVDEYCRTSIENIFACGDLTTVSTLAHSASKMGEIAAANAMGHCEKLDLSKVPSCLYTIPEAASIGMTEEEARKKGDVLVGRFDFSNSGRAMASGEVVGGVKVIADKEFGEILGVHIVGGCATELISIAKVLMDMEATIYEAAEIIYPHPSFSEAIVEACNNALGKCIHLP